MNKKRKNQIVKPILRSHYRRNGFLKWVVSHFPQDYVELVYIEPFGGELGALLIKDKSRIELIANKELPLLDVYKSIRNHPIEFVDKLKKYKFCEETFNSLKDSCDKQKSSILESSLEEYALRSMSKLEAKLKFSAINKRFWKDCIKNLTAFSARVNETFIAANEPLVTIKDFNFPDTFLFCDPPHLYETKKGKTVYQSDMPVNEHINLSHLLNSFKGKVLLSGVVSPLYSRMYKDWSLIKSKYKNKDGKTEVIWKNF